MSKLKLQISHLLTEEDGQRHSFGLTQSVPVLFEKVETTLQVLQIVVIFPLFAVGQASMDGGPPFLLNFGTAQIGRQLFPALLHFRN